MTRKTTFFEEWSWFKFNNLGLAVGTSLKFYASVAKGLKLKVRKFLGLIPMFPEVTEEKLVRRTFFASSPFWIGLNTFLKYMWNYEKKLPIDKYHPNTSLGKSIFIRIGKNVMFPKTCIAYFSPHSMREWIKI